MSQARIGAYRITGELGRGGIGVVYAAVDPAGRKVAVKRLLAGTDPDTDQRLLREASLRVEHPNVVRTLAGGLGSDGRPYLVLELLEGSTFRDALTDADPSMVVGWVAQAARGVAAIHAHGLVHRDIKPENLFVTRDGNVKVLDLGIAAFMDERARLTQTGAVIGTPAYLAPEQLRGIRALDPRVDVWALGVVLWEGLTGQSLFRREGVLATMLAVSVDPVPPLSDFLPYVSPELALTATRALERDPERRLPSAEALAQALESSLAEHGRPSAPLVAKVPVAAERSISVLVARPGAARDDVVRAIRAAAGEPLSLADGRVLGVFGAVVSRGDEANRALAVGRALLAFTQPVALALGRGAVRAREASGEAVREAGEAMTLASDGLVCGPITARALRGAAETHLVAPGLYRVGEVDPRATNLSPLLSREVELAMLRRAMDAVIEETRAVATWILGPPGAGKSRLADAVRKLRAETDPPMTLRDGQARPGASAALGVLNEALGPSAGPLLDPRLDATVRLDVARSQVLSAIRRLAANGPLVLVLEDLQWADPVTLALITELPQHLGDCPVWVVATGRPELLQRLSAPPDKEAIVEPAPLSARDAIDMARARGRGELPLRAAQALIAHTGGNPLFVELILDATEGPLESTDDWGRTPLPATVEHAVQARLDQLEADALAALCRVAILGRAADAPELVALGVQHPEAVMERLVALDLVARGSSESGRTYRTRSPVVSQVAVRSLPPVEQRALHRLAAEVTELRRRDDEEVAAHREAAGQLEIAGQAYQDAALGAVRGGDARKVLRCAERALAVAPTLASSYALSVARADAARWVGDAKVQAAALDDAEACAANDAERAYVATERGEMFRRAGAPERALPELDRAVALGQADADQYVRALCRRATVWVTLGRLAEAGDAVAAVGSEESLSPATLALLFDTRGFVAGASGDLGARSASFSEAARRYRLSGDLRRAAGAECNAADAMSRLGRRVEAEAAFRRSIELARKVGNRVTEGYALTNLGYTQAALGRNDEAKTSLRAAVAIATAVADPYLLAAARLYGCQLGIEPETTLAELSSGAHPVAVRASALALAARRALNAGDTALAVRHAEQALRLRDESDGLEEGEAEVFLVAAEALEAGGRPVEAAEVRTRARARIGELASHIRDDDARRAFVETVPEHRALLSTG